jgi:hypothetical protein
MSDYTTTPNHSFYLPVVDADDGAWGGHINSNTTALDTLLSTTGLTATGTFLPLSGGTMNGMLTLFSNPSGNMDAVPKQYVDNAAPVGGPYLALAGGTMSGGLNVTATGGNTARSVQDHFGEVINVKDFGAGGTGATDDTAAIQAALNAIPASNGGAVYFPPGKYQLTSTLTIPTAALSGNDQSLGIKIFGAGRGLTTLVTNMTSSPFMTCTVAGSMLWNLKIEDLTFQPYSSSYNAWHVIAQNVSSCVLRRCAFWTLNTGTAAAGARIFATTSAATLFYTRVVDCQFIGSVLELDNVTDAWIEGNVLQCVVSSSGARPYSLHLLNVVGDLKILRNHIYSATQGGIYSQATGGGGVLVEGNMFDLNAANTTNAVAIAASAPSLWAIESNYFAGIVGATIALTDGQSCSISGNVFHQCGGGNGSATLTFSQSSGGCHGNVVSGNVARYDPSLGTPLYFVQENAGTTGNHYVGNSVLGAGYQASPYQLVSGSLPRETFQGGIFFGSRVGNSQTDLSQHIDLFNGTFGLCIGPAYDMNIVTQTGYPLRFKCDGSDEGYINNSGLNGCAVGMQSPMQASFSRIFVPTNAGPSVNGGSGAPSGSAVAGSIYMRNDGATGTRLYVSAGGTTWNPVAGV